MDSSSQNGTQQSANSQNQSSASNSIRRYGFECHAQGTEFAILMLKNIFLTILTLGVYHFWAKANSRKFMWQSMSFAGNRFAYTGTGKELFIARLKLIGIAVAVGIVYSIASRALIAAGMGQVGPAILMGVLFAALYFVFIPFAIVSAYRYRMSRTVWKGIRLGMNDCSMEYIKTFAKGIFLTAITFGLYTPFFINDTFKLLIDNSRVGTLKLKYTGQGKDLFVPFLITIPLSMLTLGIYGIWWTAKLMNYRASHTFIGNEKDGFARMEFTATGGQLFVQFISQYLLVGFTFGLALPWAIVNSLGWLTKHVAFHGSVNLENIAQGDTGKTNAIGDSIGDALDLGVA